MAWKEKSIHSTIKLLGADPDLIREKHILIDLIKKARKEQAITQSQLAKKLGLTQGRIAQIESKVGTYNVTLDILLSILNSLKYTYKINVRKQAA